MCLVLNHLNLLIKYRFLLKIILLCCRHAILLLTLRSSTKFVSMIPQGVAITHIAKRCMDTLDTATTKELVSTGEVMTFVVSILIAFSFWIVIVFRRALNFFVFCLLLSSNTIILYIVLNVVKNEI